MATETIYVYLLDEGVDCWRPVEATRETESRYRILTENPNPSDERWEFTTGDIVVCEPRELSGANVLVAVRRVVQQR